MFKTLTLSFNFQTEIVFTQRSKVVYHDISFPNDIAINSGDKVILHSSK